jgi:hypothetical protein
VDETCPRCGMKLSDPGHEVLPDGCRGHTLSSMTEDERQEWNTAVAAANADPASPVAAAKLYELKERLLSMLHSKIMAEDNYQSRTH